MAPGRWAALASVLAACGGGQEAEARVARATPIAPAAFLLEVGAESVAVLRRPSRSLEELEAARREARGTDRRQTVRELVIAHLFALEDAGDDARSRRSIVRRAERLADAALAGNRDETLDAEMAFAKLWMSWRTGARDAGSRAERFTTRHTRAGEILMIGWMIRGEVALGDDRFDDAVTAFRFALGQLGHPLYGYALLRTAEAYRRLERTDDAQQALSEVERLGCPEGASPIAVRVAVAAAGERRSGVRRDPDGVTRPSSCPRPEARDAGRRPPE